MAQQGMDIAVVHTVIELSERALCGSICRGADLGIVF